VNKPQHPESGFGPWAVSVDHGEAVLAGELPVRTATAATAAD
jgi:hypothetical protein